MALRGRQTRIYCLCLSNRQYSKITIRRIKILAFRLNLEFKYLLQNLEKEIFSSEPRWSFVKYRLDKKLMLIKNVKK